MGRSQSTLSGPGPAQSVRLGQRPDRLANRRKEVISPNASFLARLARIDMQQAADEEVARAELRTSRFPFRYTIVALFFLSTVICYVDRVNVSVAIIPLARDRSFDAASQGLILSSFFWGYLVSQLAGGWVADRYGGKRVLAVGVAVWSIATMLTPAATASLGLLLAVRALLGIGEGVNFPAIHSLAAKWTKNSERARAVALNFTGVHLGTVLALLLSPPVILRFGWQALFYLSGALGFI